MPGRAIAVPALLALVAAAGGLLAACGEGPPGKGGPRRGGRILALGDSLTEGYGLPPAQAWPAELERRLRAGGLSWQVVNAGVSGETTGGTLARVDRVLRGCRPDVVILAIGANDGLRGADPERVRANLVTLVRRLQGSGATVILAGMRMMGFLGDAYARGFEAAYPAAATETGAALVPHLLEGVAGVPGLNQPDGLHPTAAGHRAIAATVEPYARAAISARRDG